MIDTDMIQRLIHTAQRQRAASTDRSERDRLAGYIQALNLVLAMIKTPQAVELPY